MLSSPSAFNADTQVDLLSKALPLHTDQKVDKPAQMSTVPPQLPNSHQDYTDRRMEIWNCTNGNAPLDADGFTELETGSVSRLPLKEQVAFRWKMLSIFVLQLLFVWAIVCICAYVPQANDLIKMQFQGQVKYLIGAAIGVIVLLVVLYVRCAGAAFYGSGYQMQHEPGLLQLRRVVQLHRHHDPALWTAKVLSCRKAQVALTHIRGFIAYVVVALVSCGLFIQYGRDFVTAEGFGASLGFQLVLVMWFAIDASAMYRILSSDEYMHGVIYLYTDILVLGRYACFAACGCCFGCYFDFPCCRDCCDCCIEVVCCGWRPCDEWCNSNSEKEQALEEPPVDDRVRYPPCSVLYIPDWDELHQQHQHQQQQKRATDESSQVRDLEMQRV